MVLGSTFAVDLYWLIFHNDKNGKHKWMQDITRRILSKC